MNRALILGGPVETPDAVRWAQEPTGNKTTGGMEIKGTTLDTGEGLTGLALLKGAAEIYCHP